MGRAIGIVSVECELTSYDAGKAGGSTEKYTSPRHVRLPLINRVFEPVGGILSARVIFTCAEIMTSAIEIVQRSRVLLSRPYKMQ